MSTAPYREAAPKESWRAPLERELAEINRRIATAPYLASRKAELERQLGMARSKASRSARIVNWTLLALAVVFLLGVLLHQFGKKRVQRAGFPSDDPNAVGAEFHDRA